MPYAEEVPFMFFLRPRPDGEPGAYTAEVKAAAIAAANAEADAIAAAEAARLDARWAAGLTAKTSALAAGKSAKEAAEAARLAMEGIAPVIDAPFTPGEAVSPEALGHPPPPPHTPLLFAAARSLSA